jgi:hypothetical protein
MGLGHTNYGYRGSYQVMSAIAHVGVSGYRSGDINGFHAIAANANRIKSAFAPAGRLVRSVMTSDNEADFSGWASLQYYQRQPVIVSVTDNGRVIRTSATTHDFKIVIPWTGGRHSYCVIATSTVNRGAATNLGCVNWNG